MGAPQRVADQRDGLAVDVQRLTEKLRYSSEDLEKAQASQEILLREKNKTQQSVEDVVAKVLPGHYAEGYDKDYIDA